MEQPGRELTPASRGSLVILSVGAAALLGGIGGGLASLLSRIRRLSLDVELDSAEDRRVERRR